MIIIKSSIGKNIVKLLMTSNTFNKHYAVLNWDNSFILKRTKSIEELTKTEITDDNILTLKFKYHSSYSMMGEYVAEIDKHLHDRKQLLLNIWTNEQKEKLVKQDVLNLTDETNIKISELLSTTVFKERYGDNYLYFVSLFLHPDIVKATNDERQFSEVTLKYILKTETKNSDMRHKTKINITKDEAMKLCSKISYWKR
jgi:hypothetical protein